MPTARDFVVAKEFSLTLIERLLDEEARDRVEISLTCLPTIAETKPLLIKVN